MKIKVFEQKKDITSVSKLYILVTFLKHAGIYSDIRNISNKIIFSKMDKPYYRFYTNISYLLLNNGYFKSSIYVRAYYQYLRDNYYNFTKDEEWYLMTFQPYTADPLPKGDFKYE